MFPLQRKFSKERCTASHMSRSSSSEIHNHTFQAWTSWIRCSTLMSFRTMPIKWPIRCTMHLVSEANTYSKCLKWWRKKAKKAKKVQRSTSPHRRYPTYSLPSLRWEETQTPATWEVLSSLVPHFCPLHLWAECESPNQKRRNRMEKKIAALKNK